MVRDPKAEEEQNRLHSYLDEIREFLASRGVATGKPDDIAPFAASLAEGGALEDEMGAILRSIVYRESEKMGRGELLELLTTAVGGPALDGIAPGMQGNIRTIFLFLGKALRQQRPSYQPEQAAPAARRQPETAPPQSREIEAPAAEEPLRPAEAVLPEAPQIPAVAVPETKPVPTPEPPVLPAQTTPRASLVFAEAAKPKEKRPEEMTASSLPANGVSEKPSLSPSPAPAPLPASVQVPEAAPVPPAPVRSLNGALARSSHPYSPWIAAEDTGPAPPPAPRVGETPPEPSAGRVPPSPEAQEQNVLYRALSLATPQEFAPEDSLPAEEVEEAEARGSLARWLVPAIVAALVMLGLAFYFGRPGHHATQANAEADGLAEPSGKRATSCTPPSPGTVSRSGLDERSRWAHNLLDQKLYDVALPEIREIARLDPSYPGIRLDESDALLNLKRPDEARAAVDAQISMSQCLAGLPPAALRTYCGLHYPTSPLSGCQAQMAHVRQQAELQAALVHLELGHGSQAGDVAGVAVDRVRSGHKPSRKKTNP